MTGHLWPEGVALTGLADLPDGVNGLRLTQVEVTAGHVLLVAV